MQPDLSHLPPSAQTLIAIIGLPAALHMVDKHGGKTLRLYTTGESMTRVQEAIGHVAAGALWDHFGSDPFIVPKCRDALNNVRNARIHAEFDRMTKTERRSGRDSIHRLVEAFRLSERQVWRILKKSSITPGVKKPQVDSRQLNLL